MADRLTVAFLLLTQGKDDTRLRAVLRLADALADSCEVHVLAAAHQGVNCPARVRFHGLDVTAGRLGPRLYWRVWSLLRALRPDVIHAQDALAVRLLSGLKWLLPRPLRVATRHAGTDDPQAYRAMHGVVVTSGLTGKGVPVDTRVIHEGAPPPPELQGRERKAIRALLLAGQDLPLLMAPAPLRPERGVETLVRAMAGVDARLALIGEGPERARLEELVTTLGLSDRVHFLGARRDIGQLLQAADLCLIPSSHDGLPAELTAALRVGCPVLAAGVADAGDWLPEALCPPDNAEAVRERLCATLARQPLLRRNYLPVFLRARQELTMAGMAQCTAHYYQYLLDRPR